MTDEELRAELNEIRRRLRALEHHQDAGTPQSETQMKAKAP